MMWDFSSVCCNYHWYIKELICAYSGAIEEQNQVEKTNLNPGRKEADLETSHAALPEPDGTLDGKPQPCSSTLYNSAAKLYNTK